MMTKEQESPDKQVDNKESSSSTQQKDGRGKNPASQANLKPFEKGHSGNPGGKRLKGQEFIDALKEHGKTREQRHRTNYSTGKEWVSDEGSYNFQVVDKIWNKAREGELPYIRLLVEMGALKPSIEEVQERVEMKRKGWAELAEKIEKGETTYVIRQQEEEW
jgi:hypothetical protein|tara:strand:- start:4 stop:489 length:486 start_codon:yes stop_codon:yes gene_type:complete